MQLDFTGRRVVVTGGTGALGSAVVALLLESGASCDIPCHDERELERCTFAKDPRVRIQTGIDLTDEAHVERFFAQAAAPLWASVQIAGGFSMGPVADVRKAGFVSMMQMNALTCFLCCREAARAMHEGGRIVNVGARPGLIPELGAGMVPYTASKAAVLAITQSLAAELAPRGIWVNAVVPSIMDTPANRKAMPDADHAKWATVAGVARTIAFLASPQNLVTRGACIPVYAGA